MTVRTDDLLHGVKQKLESGEALLAVNYVAYRYVAGWGTLLADHDCSEEMRWGILTI
jgi:hypothetical protein